MSVRRVSPDLDLFVWYTDLLDLPQVFVIMSVSPLPCNLGSPSLVHSLNIEGTCQSGTCQSDMYHLTFTSFSWSTDFINFMFMFEFHGTLISFFFWKNVAHRIWGGQAKYRSVSTLVIDFSFHDTMLLTRWQYASEIIILWLSSKGQTTI